MDRIRKTNQWLSPKRRRLAVILAGCVGLAWLALNPFSTSNSATVAANDIKIGFVSKEEFTASLSVRGGIAPQTTVFLDAIESGRVEEIFVREGEFVEEGQVLLRLSNTSLQLDVVSREAQVAEQLNNLRNTRIVMEQDRLSIKREVTELEYELAQAKRDRMWMVELKQRNYISEKELADLISEQEYLEKRLSIAEERQMQNELLRASQLDQLEQSASNLQRNLDMAKRSLDNLMITATTSGYLTGMTVEKGEFVSLGTRLGQVDNLEQVKVVANIDEFYLDAVSTGERGTAEIRGKSYPLTVTKVYPQVINGRFKVDLEFSESQPADLSRGQSVNLDIHLGSEQMALVIPAGPYLSETNGNWIFVVNEDGEASRQKINTGKRNDRFYEVTSGLNVGDRVIVSSYNELANVEKIRIN